jgi:hypothetical protein
VSEERKQQILNAINVELRTQGNALDPVALAGAIDAALGGDALEAGANLAAGNAAMNGAVSAGSSPKGRYTSTDEGKTPDQLDASNDD